MPQEIKTMPDQIADHIQQAIIEGKFFPGSWVKEKDIMNWLRVSRTPIREAFRILAAKDMVQITSNKGVRISILSKKNLIELFELRMMIEVHCLGKFIELVEDQHIQELEIIIRKMDDTIKYQDQRSYFELALDFHSYYVEGCSNTKISSIYHDLKNSIRCAQVLFIKISKKDKGNTIEEHTKILEAIKKRDSKKALRLLSQHLSKFYERIEKIVDYDGPDQPIIPPIFNKSE